MSEPFRLSISHLSLIRDILRETNFDETKWHDLGLSLNILQPQLKSIKDSYSQNSHQCLLECLSLWLESENPLPQLLEIAVKSIAIVAAESIHKILVNSASQMLLRHSSKFSWVILPTELLALLRSEGVISKKTQSEVSQNGLLVGEPLRAVCVTVAEDQKKLRVLGDVLLKFDRTVAIGKEILEDYSNCESIQKNELDDHLTSTQPQLQEKKFRVRRGAHQCSFEAMRGKFCIFIEQMKSTCILSSMTTRLEELKQFLERYDPELKSQLQQIQSFDGIFKILEKKCNIVNVAAMETIANRYELKDGISLVSKYKEEIKKFSNEMKLAFTLNGKLSLASNSSLTCEKIEFLLDWEPSDRLFEDICLLLERAFDDLANEIIIQIIQKTNSILIICYAPLYLMNAMFLEAQANLPSLLKEVDLIHLTIGHYTVYDRNKEKEMKSLEEKLQLSINKESLLLKRIESLELSLKEKTEHIKSLKIPATESELKNELQVRQKQLSSLRLENEQLITSFKSKRDELQEEISLLTAQSLQLQENDKIQQEKLKQLLKELEDSKAELEISLAEGNKTTQKVSSEHGEVLNTDKQIVLNKKIPHHEDVVNLLQRFGFPETKSEELGMALNIDLKDLDQTKLKSLTECVSQWIMNGRPLFVSLSRALRSINEIAIADKLDQEISVERTPDLVLAAFDYHSDNVLIHSLASHTLIAKTLYGDGIIKGEVLNQMEKQGSTAGQRYELLSAIRESIKINYSVLDIFANVLGKYLGNEPIRKALLRDYGAIVKVEAKEGTVY